MKSVPIDESARDLGEVLHPPTSPLPISRPAVPVRRFFWIILALLAAVSAVTFGTSALLQHTRLKDRLTAHIATALGRPVEVGSFDFTLWGGPRLEAQSVSVAEDPRFGQEYFLRAESISLRFRWGSLLRGHFAIDTVSLVRPSLNLVRNAAGDWNLAEWLPRPVANSIVGAPYPLPLFPTVRFRRIEIDGGRINFKRSDDKLPLALIGLTGEADTDSSGRWRIELTATPWRAAVPVQQAGVLHASGYVGGTSSRLRPAKLDMSWSDASLSDVLRLGRADDYGIRGTLGASISAATRDQDDAWTIHAHVQLSQVHRWDLALRGDNPRANVIVDTEWHPAGAWLELDPVLLEGPHSSARLSARVSWAQPRHAPKLLVPPVYVELSGSRIDAGDILSWIRAFHSGIADDASLQGLTAVRGVVSGWPPHIVNAGVSTDGVTFGASGLRGPVRIRDIQFRYDHGLMSLLPTELSFGNPENALRLESSAKSGSGVSNTVRVSGSFLDVHDLLAAASALGWQLARAPDLAGPVRGDLRWQGADYPWREPAVGFIEWGTNTEASGAGASVRVPFLNLPVDQIRARLDLKLGARHVTLASAQAFGGRWSGTLDGRAGDPEWRFSLSADHLATADFDRWLNPRWRQSFLDRMFPFLNSRLPSAGAMPETIHAAGHVNLARFNVGSLALTNMEGQLRVDGRAIDLQNAAAQLGGGVVNGSFSALVQASPSYESNVNFSRVDLASITDGDPLLASLFGGSASGKASFRAKGATRAELLASLDCRGTAVVARPLLRKIDLLSSLGDGISHPGSSLLSGASADFSCAQQTVRIENLSLDSPEMDSALQGFGTVDFARNASLTLRSSTSGSPVFRLSGTLASPEISIVPVTPPRRSR